MTVYDDLKAEIATLTASDVFKDGVLTRSGGTGTYDPLTRTTSAVAPLKVPCRAVDSTAKTRAQDGTLTLTTLITLTVEPKEGDTLALDGSTYTLSNVSTDSGLIYYATATR